MSMETSDKRLGLFLELEEYVKDTVEIAKLKKFIDDALQDKPIRHYFVWQTMERPLPHKTGEPVETIKATIVADNSFFEFIYSNGRYRYDVQPLNIFSRIEEIHYTEDTLDGKAIPVIQARIDGKYQLMTQSYSVKGEKAAELKQFLRAVHQLIQS